MTEPHQTTVDDTEVERFSRLAAEWWNPRGKFKPLHVFNPVRLSYLRERLLTHFGRDGAQGKPLGGLAVVDIGCGGGLLCEPLTRLGASVTGIDPSQTNIGVARSHAETMGLMIDYRATTAEALAAENASFDVVLAMEVVEHVADVPLFLDTCARLVRPGGLIVVATINRTRKAYALAILGAEYVLGWLPRGTHAFDKLVKPEEVERPLEAAGLTMLDRTGVGYDPLRDRWRLVSDMDVNYIVLAGRPA